MGLDWLRKAHWLDRNRARGYLLLLAAFNLAGLIWLLATSHGGVDRNGYLLGTDFLGFWAAGKVLAAGGSPYDTAAHIAMQRTIYAGHSGYTAFFYPPPFLAWCRALGLADYFPALAGWLLATGAAYALALRAWLRSLPAGQFALALGAFPPLFLTLTHGQTSFLVAALLGGGCWLVVQGHKGWGGVLFGLAVIKPQFGLLLPLLLLAAREWRVILSAGATVAALALATTLGFGSQVWSEWLAVSGPAQEAMAGGAVGFAKMQSTFAAVRLAGGGLTLAYGLQGAVTLGCAVLIAGLGWRRGVTPETAAAMLAASLLATPFVLDYDLVLLGFPLALLATSPARAWERSALVAGFALGAYARPLGLSAGIALAPLVIAVLFALLVLRCREPESTRAPS